LVFSSPIFIYYFLPVALLSYYGLYKAPQRARNLLLAILGYVFYGWANPRFIFLMFGTTFLDWLLSLLIATDSWDFRKRPIGRLAPGPRSRLQRGALVTSLVSNLTMLGFFKYFNFGVDSYNGLMSDLGLGRLAFDSALRVILPLGISFYTFQSLSYIIDVYRGDAKAMRSFVDFSCFVSMFPHLVAGPILKFSFLADQLEHRTLTRDKFARGVAFFTLGMTKKILLANPCGKVADTIFSAASVNAPEAWYGAVAYAFQIFLDFSAYSEMAIGLGLMLGFVFARNFDKPYRSASITEFWRRWHISLSTWLREYLYIPLGGNRKGKFRTYVNLFLTMTLGGLWHGASWNFVIWGGLHGSLLALERMQGRQTPYRLLPRFAQVTLTFGIVVLSWVFFRAADLPGAISYLKSMAGVGGVPPAAHLLSGIVYQPYYLLCMALAALAVWILPDPWEWTQKLTAPKMMVCLGLFAVALAVLATQSYNPFIYFIF
jgi:alginate O-acetyltransferase complex protein AlgI